MKIETINTKGFKFIETVGNKEVGRVFLYFMRNDIKGKWFSYIEDLYVSSDYRGKGIATKLIKECIKKSKEENAYKVVLTTQYEYLWGMYETMGFNKTGTEFKMYL
jgi:ribosomal protein S18 acetylase RimI-like enzyme